MNSLEIIFQTRKVEPDRRYRVLVSLQRADRPRYWIFHCPNCGTKLCELQSQEVISMQDFFDAQNVNNHGVGIRCNGAYKGEYCRYWYFLQLA